MLRAFQRPSSQSESDCRLAPLLVASWLGRGLLLSCGKYLELTTEPCKLLSRYRDFPRIFILFLSVPEFISSQCVFRSADSVSRSSLDMSGLMETRGVSASFLWFAGMPVTLQEQDSLTRIGLRFLFVYLPRRTKSRIELQGIDGSSFCITVVMSSMSWLYEYVLWSSGHSFIP